jgi:2-polyprenyl-3-methyl-5-hydroxy-6-metoxy-1,4-benzoquinol methylase
MKCPNCNFLNKKYFYKYKEYNAQDYDLRCTSLQYQKPNLIKCTQCSLIFSELVNIKFEKLYGDVVDEQYIKSIEFKRRYFENTFSKIKKYINKYQEVLEIGSYYGVFGSIIAPKVKKYLGIELSGHAVEFAKKKYSLNVYSKSIDQHLVDVEKLDVIIMSHVIEHLDNPFTDLKNIRDKMTDKSILIFSTYNMDSLIAKILGKKYHWIMPMHKFYFTKSFLKEFMNNNGLELVETITDTHTTSLKYFFIKIKVILPFFKFILNPLSKIEFLNKIYFKINLGDLDLYIVKKNRNNISK